VRRFYDWAFAQVAGRELRVERAIAAQHGSPDPSDLLHTRYRLDGFGTDNWPNFQLDGFGTLLWGAAQHLLLSETPLPVAWRASIELVVRYIAALWRLPCYDCWEEFADHIHVSTLAALFGGLTAAGELLGAPSYSNTASTVRSFVLREGVRDGVLSKFLGSSLVDGSLVHVATPYRLLEPNDPLMRATITRIESEWRRNGGGVYRYVEDTYYGGGQGVLLTAYLGWYYSEVGESARALVEWIEHAANEVGHLPEQLAVDLNQPGYLPIWNERWGASACPLLWSHAAYITLRAHVERSGVGSQESGVRSQE
jgi:GH15 family glucan-1,4-alpha-glucosidase